MIFKDFDRVGIGWASGLDDWFISILLDIYFLRKWEVIVSSDSVIAQLNQSYLPKCIAKPLSLDLSINMFRN